MTQAEALRLARYYVMLTPQGRRWAVESPHDWTNLDSHHTTTAASDYWHARGRCTEIRAELALRLLGHTPENAYTRLHRAKREGAATLLDIVRMAHKGAL